MARSTYVLRDGKLVEKHLAAPLEARPSSAYVISDCMDAAAHPCTGRMMDSKSQFRRVTRAHGCVEMGNDAPTSAPKATYDSEGLKRDIAQAMRNPDRRPIERFDAYRGDGWH